MIKYDNLKVGDIVLVGSRSLFGYVIRWVTGGWKNRHKRDSFANHVGIVTEWKGEKIIAEMLVKTGLSITTFKSYELNKRSKIIAVNRPVEITRGQRNRLAERIARDWRIGIEYDKTGVLAFISKNAKNAKDKNFCSEYIAERLSEETDVLLNELPKNISPNEFQLDSPCCHLEPVDWRE